MRKSSQQIKYITLSAMLSALGVIIMAIGAFIEVLDLSTAVLASMLCIYAVIEIRGSYPWMIWLVTSLLALLLLPVKAPALIYALFAGFYPILKEKLEKLSRILSWVLKLTVFHLSMLALALLMKLVFHTEIELGTYAWMPFLIYPLALVCFVVYDLALTRLITFYLFRLRKHFKIK